MSPDFAPAERLRVVRDQPIRPGGRYVLYWMTATRRLAWSHALDHAITHAKRLGLPLVVLEALRVDYRWASLRHHGFVVDGMAANAAEAAEAPLLYHPYVEPEPGAARGLLETLAAEAAVVVTDEAPVFFLPRMLDAAARRIPARIEAVDDCGVLPLSVSTRTFTTAASFRRHAQRVLPDWLLRGPSPRPLAGLELPRLDRLPGPVDARWPATSAETLRAPDALLSTLPIDRVVGRAAIRGGRRAGLARLDAFVGARLARYAEHRNHPDAEVTSGLSPYLHYGHVSAREVVAAVLEAAEWTPARLLPRATGSREGWWGAGVAAEAVLDQLVTWRELGLNMCHTRPDDHDDYASLPEWARETLADHAADPRPYRFDDERLESARTGQPIWDAAQRELRETGLMHNYLRMVWGKKILEWTPSPQAALRVMIELNNRWALDGRDPNSYSGIFWVLGRYDRAWGPERPVFGKIRYMSLDATRRKLKLDAYLRRWSRD